MKLIYPACFYPRQDGRGYSVEVPDLPGCVTQGDDLADAMLMAVDAASGWVLDELEDGKAAPAPSALHDIHLDSDDGFVNLIALDMDSYAEQYGDKSVRKNITIPAWMDTQATKMGVNFSSIMQHALEELLQVSYKK